VGVGVWCSPAVVVVGLLGWACDGAAVGDHVVSYGLAWGSQPYLGPRAVGS